MNSRQFLRGLEVAGSKVPDRRIGRMFAMLWLIALAVWLAIGDGRAAAEDSLSAREEQSFKAAAALAEPSIVRIETVGGLDLVGELLTGVGATTGVVVSPDGLIITSTFNFAAKPAGIIVTLPDGRRFPADVVATDAARMLTLLKIEIPAESSPLTPLAPVPRSETRVGQWSIALGRTYDQAFPNLSVGIVSAVDRVWGKAIQTDAKISPANYGGPLVDLHGRGLGILVPLSPDKSDETAGVEWYDGGIGFAIPMEDVYRSLERLRAGESLKPGLMGVGFPDQSVLAGEARVDHVRPESPADIAGVLVGDVIVEAAGEPVDRVPDLKHVLGRMYAGEQLAFVVLRGTERLPLQLELAAELPVFSPSALGILPARRASGESTEGIEVRDVLPGSPAALAGVKRRDRILRVGDVRMATGAELRRLVSRTDIGTSLDVHLSREGREETLSLTTTAMSTELPPDVPAASLPAPVTPVPASLLGRYSGVLAGNEQRRYWRYVPEHYNPAFEYGLIVWLHPAGDTLERALLTRWQEHCDRRGIILLAPYAADVQEWTADEAEFVRDLIAETRQQFRIDASRIVLHGHAAGGTFAWEVGFKYRELFRGICVSGAPLREVPPDNDPDFPCQICLVSGDRAPNAAMIEQSRALFERLGYPVTALSVSGAATDYPDETIVGRLALWLDLLDRF